MNELKNVNITFFEIVDKLAAQVHTADMKFITDRCCTLMASDIQNIKLFTDSFIKKIRKCPCSSLIKYYLLPFITWFDNTVLIELVAACEKIDILEQLYKVNNCVTDDNQPITSYSIPKFSQFIIPLDDSEYTIIAIKTFQNCGEFVLQNVKDIKEFLKSQWELTAHAIQLAAIDYHYNFIYWMIPKQVQSLIEIKLSEGQYYLWRGGIFQAILLPSNFYSIENDFNQQIANNPFNISKLLLKDSLKVGRNCYYFYGYVVLTQQHTHAHTHKHTQKHTYAYSRNQKGM